MSHCLFETVYKISFLRTHKQRKKNRNLLLKKYVYVHLKKCTCIMKNTKRYLIIDNYTVYFIFR